MADDLKKAMESTAKVLDDVIDGQKLEESTDENSTTTTRAKLSKITTNKKDENSGEKKPADNNNDNRSRSSPGSDTSNDSAIPDEPQPNKLQKRQTSSSSPHNTTANAVLLQLEQMIVTDEWTRKETSPTDTPSGSGQKKKAHKPTTEPPRLTDLGRSLVTSYSLKAYIDLLGVQHRQSIGSWLYGNACQQLSGLFRLPNARLHCAQADSVAVHSVRNGIGQAIRLALNQVYGGDYEKIGWRCFEKTGEPVVYVSPALHMDLGPYITAEFGLDQCVVVGKCESPLAEVEGRLNHNLLEELLNEDAQKTRKPLLVVAVVGSAIFGQNDLVSRLIELRRQHGFWLHVVGQGLAALALKDPPETLIKVLTQVDSCTLPLAQWLGVPAAPVITLYKSAGELKPSYRDKLDTLPWWVAAQYLTTKRMTDILEHAYFLSKILLKGLANFPRIHLFGVPNVPEFADKVYTGQYPPLTVITFKYDYHSHNNNNGIINNNINNNDNPDETTDENNSLDFESMEYADSLNSWLGQGLISECRLLGLHLIELGGHQGTAFRFCPLESAAASGTRGEHVQHFLRQLGETLLIVDATVRARRRLPDIIRAHTSLCQALVKKWAGVGAVCYVPSIVKDSPPIQWNEKQREQVSHLNLELVHSLRATDSAFSSGESSNPPNVSCVKFGMLADDKDLDDLIGLIAERGKAIEDSAQYMESLAQMIRQGIDAANKDLRKENDERLMQEGVIRQLPIMGSLVNWLSPLDKETSNIKGRCFDLKTGQIKSTGVLYKQRLQMNEGVPLPPSPHDVTPSGGLNDTPQIPHAKNAELSAEASEPTSATDQQQ